MLDGLRILHIHTLPIVSGSGINTFLSMEGSRRQGAEVSLACAPGGRLEEVVRQSGMGFFPIRNFVSPVSPWRDLDALWQLLRLLRREHFDIVHTHNSKAGFLGRLAARTLGVPLLVHTVHGFAFHGQESRLRRRLFVWLERLAARWSHQLIAISQAMIDWAQKEGIADSSRFAKVYSGIEVDRFKSAAQDPELKRQLGIRQGQVVIGMVSKLWQGKGHQVLIQAASRLESQGLPFQILIVGEGGLEADLKAMVKRRGLEERVCFAGFRSDLPQVTAQLDIACLPSFYEGMGRVALEAMAAGKPMVASAVGGLAELVQDGVTGFLVPAGDPDALASRLERLVSDSALRCKMGEEGARRVDERFSAARMIEQIHQIYQRLLTECGGSAVREPARASDWQPAGQAGGTRP